jgi:hypothetical protein
MHLLTALVCAAHNATHSTTTATVTKTVFHTVTTSVNLATLPGIAPQGPALSSAAASNYAPSIELKSIFVQTIELTSTVFSTEVDGVVVTSLSTVVAPVTSTATATSTAFQEVTSISTKQIGTTITTTSVIVSATTPRVTTSTSHIPIEQDIAQMWGLNGSAHLVAGNWLVFSVVLLSVAHYLLFAHY